MSSDSGKEHTNSFHRDEVLDRIQTAGSIVMSPKLFEQLYLAPHSNVKGQLRQTFGNPTPLALGGFLLCSTPLSMALLGWQDSGGFSAAANVATYFFLGGLLLLLGGIGEWILGNTFPATVFCVFGGFWFSFGATIVPAYASYATYAPENSAAAAGLDNPQFYSTFAMFLICMAILSFIFLLASTRTNIVFFGIFLLLTPCFGCLSGSYLQVSKGNSAQALTLQHVGAGLLFGVSLLGWYIFLALVLLSVEFPITIPLGDLSTIIPGSRASRKSQADTV